MASGFARTASPCAPISSPLSDATDVYFSADVETDGPIPGEFSMLSFALVYAGTFDGTIFRKAANCNCYFSRELQPISPNFQVEALQVNGLDRDRLTEQAPEPTSVMHEAARWLAGVADGGTPVLVAYPLSFDWAWLYWYFVKFTGSSPFSYSHCFDLKTAVAVKRGIPISLASRRNLPPSLQPSMPHTHRALDDAIEQAEIFAKVFEWKA